MRRSILLALALLPAALVLGSALVFAQVDDPEVAAYLDLTVARLELVRDTLQQQGRMLTGDEEKAFFVSRGTTDQAYYAFAGEHPGRIEDYLTGHGGVADQIDALTFEIDALIEAAETAQEAEEAEAS